MKIFENIRKEDLPSGYVDIVWYCQRYFDFEKIDQFKRWHKNLILCKDKKEWNDASGIIKTCLCTPGSSATLERFFSHLKLVKTYQKTVLCSESLSAILRIKLWQTPLMTFHNQYTDRIVTHWYNQKGRGIDQGKRREYKKWNCSK